MRRYCVRLVHLRSAEEWSKEAASACRRQARKSAAPMELYRARQITYGVGGWVIRPSLADSGGENFKGWDLFNRQKIRIVLWPAVGLRIGQSYGRCSG